MKNYNNQFIMKRTKLEEPFLDSDKVINAQDSSKRPSKFVDAMKCGEYLLSKKLYEKFVLQMDFTAVPLGNNA